MRQYAWKWPAEERSDRANNDFTRRESGFGALRQGYAEALCTQSLQAGVSRQLRRHRSTRKAEARERIDGSLAPATPFSS